MVARWTPGSSALIARKRKGRERWKWGRAGLTGDTESKVEGTIGESSLLNYHNVDTRCSLLAGSSN
jgi:hypothetical protein